MKLIATAVFALVLGVVVTNIAPAQAAAAENTTDTEVTYKYVAQSGDSYSLIARKAVQTYGKKFKVELTLGQVLFAETNVTLGAGSPLLTEGQKVSIKETTIKTWVEKAKKLTTAQNTAWMAYAQYADFNTDHVGQG